MIELNKIEYGERSGYSEMFEWAEQLPIKNVNPLGKFVQFSEQYPGRIIRAKNIKNIVGITTINTGSKVSNPNYWPYRYLLNEFGDLYLKEDTIACSKKEYDSTNEFSYMSTYPKQVHLPIVNSNYDESKKYLERTNRLEWSTVTILGKVIVEDDGNCEQGKYCTLYNGNDETKYGIAQPAKEDDQLKIYVLERLSNHTILVYFTPQIYLDIK